LIFIVFFIRKNWHAGCNNLNNQGIQQRSP